MRELCVDNAAGYRQFTPAYAEDHHEDGGDMLLRTVKLSSKPTALHPRKQRSLYARCEHIRPTRECNVEGRTAVRNKNFRLQVQILVKIE
jgi:phage/plasmid-associated DNA primase